MNTNIIQPIDRITVNKICSGQVVLNLATAVKELIENSIDAGSNSIQVRLEEYGSNLIEIVDNGCGVEEVNFQALTLKHHTSKISKFSDLSSVSTFGFRGEALSSLCSLSNVTIITKHKNAKIGSTLKFDHNGIIVSNSKTLRKIGTTVKLENLFITLPIRRSEFLKNLKREFSKMCNVLFAYGLQSIGIRIFCTNQVSKTKVFTKNSPEETCKKLSSITIMDIKGDSVESNIVSLFGIKQKQNLLKIVEKFPSENTLNEFGLSNKIKDTNTFNLNGFISSCAHGCGRTSSDRQFFFINSRPVDCQKISKLVNDIYHQFNNKQYPFVVLNIKVAVGFYDMNVTPDKRQILIQNEKLLLAIVKETVVSMFQVIPSILEIQNIRIPRQMSSNILPGTSKQLEELTQPNAQNSLHGENDISRASKRIDDLLKKHSKPWESIKGNIKEKNCTNRINVTNVQSNQCKTCYHPNQEVTILTPKQNELKETMNKSIDFNNGVTVKKELTDKYDNINELLYDVDILKKYSAPTVTDILELQRNNIKEVKKDVKRKLTPDTYKCSNISETRESDESTQKKIKLDEGLKEEVKSKRKRLLIDINLYYIKKTYSQLKNSNKLEAKVEKSEIKFLSEINPQSNKRAEQELKKEIKKDSFFQMEIIGQFNLGFIITKLSSDIFIVDQHASDEKYNFEMLQTTTVIQTQKMVNPETLELTVDKEELMLQHRDVFTKNGFDFIFNELDIPTKRIKLTSVPISKNMVFGKEDVDELLFLLEDAPVKFMIRPSRVGAMFASRACRKSVMIGTPLNHQEMRKIINHMGEIEQPWNCPHGRPTIRHLVNLNMFDLKHP